MPFALWVQFIKLGLILMVILFGVSMFSFFIASCVSLLDFRIAMFLVTMISSLILFVVLHLIFAIPAIVLLRHKPTQAIRESFMLTRSDFFNVTLLLLLLWIIGSGFNFVWSLPDPTSGAMLIGIAGQAFVSTALIATLFIFFQQRLAFLEMLAKAYAAKESPAQPAVGE
jgi:membrane-anchored glycerophosphoryl diester phosphodiesterase (GDPDase)